jgi:fucose 4-O-acetylase-like acetyltransferase
MGGAFFALGLFARTSEFLATRRLAVALVGAIFAVVWISIMWTADRPQQSYLEPSPLDILAAVTGVVATLSFCFLLPKVNGGMLALLALLGQASLAIYVMHTIFAAGLRILLYRTDIFYCDLHVVLETLVGLLAPAVLFVVANKMKIAPYVGFGRLQKVLYGQNWFDASRPSASQKGL